MTESESAVLSAADMLSRQEQAQHQRHHITLGADSLTMSQRDAWLHTNLAYLKQDKAKNAVLLGQIPYPAVVGSKVNVGAGVISVEVLPQLARPAYVPAIAVNSGVAVQPVLATGVEACIDQQQSLASYIAAGQPWTSEPQDSCSRECLADVTVADCTPARGAP